MQPIEATCQRITIRDVSGQDAETLSDVLLGLGVQSVVVSEHQRREGEAEQKIYDIDSALWDLCDLDVHIALEDDPGAVISEATEASVELKWSAEPIENREWVQQIKDSYIPLQITPDLFIVPEWSKPTSTSPLGSKNIILQPGVAFGTGEHPTTRLCLLQIEKWGREGLLDGVTVMDYGAGSGVLAIAALLYGASSAVGTDTDPLAVRVAQRNAHLNNLGDKMAVIQCSTSARQEDEPIRKALEAQGLVQNANGSGPLFDLVVSNILRGPLIDLSLRMSSYSSPGGRLLLSGILVGQANEIIEAYRDDFTDFLVLSDNGWACITATSVKK